MREGGGEDERGRAIGGRVGEEGKTERMVRESGREEESGVGRKGR